MLDERNDWRPLSRRGVSTGQDALFGGVPAHPERPLTAWVTTYLHGREELIQQVALRLRVALDAVDPERLVDAVRADDPTRLLDLIDAVVHWDPSLHYDLELGPSRNSEAGLADWIPDYVWPKDSCAERLDKLHEMLADAGSAYTLDWSHRCLVRRVDDTVTAAAQQAMVSEPGGHLRAAWAAAYGRHPDPNKAYDEAVRAVEAAAIPVVLPDGSRETLGKVLAHFRQAAGKWELAIEGPSAGAVEPLIGLIKLLWEGHQRHPGSPTSRSHRQDEAEMAVHVATTLVQSFESGWVRRRSSP